MLFDVVSKVFVTHEILYRNTFLIEMIKSLVITVSFVDVAVLISGVRENVNMLYKCQSHLHSDDY